MSNSPHSDPSTLGPGVPSTAPLRLSRTENATLVTHPGHRTQSCQQYLPTPGKTPRHWLKNPPVEPVGI